ncbi:hypothetical protein V8E36_009359, partial [Tilletia maclaganii]
MTFMKPLPSVCYPDAIAGNQQERAHNMLPGNNRAAHVEQIRKDIRDFKATASTRSSSGPPTRSAAPTLSPASTTRPATSSRPLSSPSPRTPLFPTALSFAECHKAFLEGDDLKKGQTMVKSVLAELVVNVGIKPLSIASYDHLGNNDGRNLSSRALPGTTKKMVDRKVFADKGEHPDHCIAIKYIRAVGDTKDPRDTGQLHLGTSPWRSQTSPPHQLMRRFPPRLALPARPRHPRRAHDAHPMRRPSDKPSDGAVAEINWESMHSVLSLLSYSLEAPLCKPKTDVVNSLSRQRTAVTNMLRLADSGVIHQVHGPPRVALGSLTLCECVRAPLLWSFPLLRLELARQQRQWCSPSASRAPRAQDMAFHSSFGL